MSSRGDSVTFLGRQISRAEYERIQRSGLYPKWTQTPARECEPCRACKQLFPADDDADYCPRCAALNRGDLTDPEYGDVEASGQISLGVPGEQRCLDGLSPERQEA